MSRILIAGLVIALLAGCSEPLALVGVKGSGKLVSQSYQYSGFTKIDAGNSAQVEVARGDTYSVNVEVDDNLVDRLEVSVNGDTLHIGLKSGAYRNETLRAQVTMPKLTGVTLSGASTLTGQLAGEDLEADLSGASRATLTGTAGKETIEASGASQALLGGLVAGGDVKVNASGASRIEINTSGAVTGEASGGATVVVSGPAASVNVQASGGAQVNTK